MEPKHNDYGRWVKTVHICWDHGWECVRLWVFRSPKGTLHDLSAADLSQLERIQDERLFLAGE